MKTLIVATVALLATGMNVSQAQESEREAILAVTEQAFAAVKSQNPDDWRAIQLAQGTTLSFRPHPSGEAGKLEMRMANSEEFVAGMKKTEQEYAEYWIGEPTVLIRGPIAVVWGEYEFTIDGKLSHCGVDAIDLVKLDGEWKIANIMWTAEKENCPSSAGG